MRRLAMVLGMLLLPLLPSVAAAQGTWDVTISGRVLAFDGLPVQDITVEAWESDTGYDDYSGQKRTDEFGRFDWRGNVTDREGIVTPDVYLKVRFSGAKLHLTSNPTFPTAYLTGRMTDVFHVDDFEVSDHRAVINVGDVWLDAGSYMTAAGKLYNSCQGTLRAMSSRGQTIVGLIPNSLQAGFCGEYSNEFGTRFLIYSIGADAVFYTHFPDREFIECNMEAIQALSGTPPPAGGGFETVTNEGYAWDEGVIAFLLAALTNNPSAPGVGLESGVAAPASAVDAPKIGATVAASLYDLYDSHDDGYDSYDGTLTQIMNVLYGRPVHSLAEFWAGWKADGLPKHLPVMALYANGVNYNTLPVWADGVHAPDPVIVNPGQTIAYRLDLEVSDAESSDQELTFTSGSLVETTDPVNWYVSGNTLYATMNPSDPPGHAFFNVGANDGLAIRYGYIRLHWGEDQEDPPDELDGATTTRPDEGSGVELALTGPAVIRSVGRFEFTLPAAAEARLSVYDVSGRLVDTIAEGFHSAGRHEVVWSAEASKGKAGIYFLELRTGDQRRMMRTVLVR